MKRINLTLCLLVVVISAHAQTPETKPSPPAKTAAPKSAALTEEELAQRERRAKARALLVALGASEHTPVSSTCPFILPARFRARMAAREPFHLLRDTAHAGRLVAFDGRRRVPLAVMRDTQAIPPPFNALSAQARESLVPWDDFALLLRAFHLGISRVCRTRAGLGLRGLVLRRGRLVATRTHLDVIFDHQQVDLRIRRAGLDIDPGWVPWLARVIRYHYLYGELPGD